MQCGEETLHCLSEPDALAPDSEGLKKLDRVVADDPEVHDDLGLSGEPEGDRGTEVERLSRAGGSGDLAAIRVLERDCLFLCWHLRLLQFCRRSSSHP